jgi:hypothetical protein
MTVPWHGFPLDDVARALAPFVGEWDSVGVHGMIPDTVLHGHASIERLEPGGFLRIRTAIAEQVGIPAGVQLLGGDGDSGRYVLLHHDARGVTRIYDAAVEGSVLRWWRDGRDFAQRYVLTVAPDGRTMIGKGELSRDGAAWQQDLDLTYTRVDR